MNREVHVRFCERRGVRFPSATHPIYDSFERGDYSSAEWAHPDIEWVIADGPSPGTWTGLAGMREGWLEMANAWQQLGTVVDEYRERVLLLISRRGRGKTSGVELGGIGSEGAHLLHVRDNKVTRIVSHWDRERALADCGLAPDAASPGS